VRSFFRSLRDTYSSMPDRYTLLLSEERYRIVREALVAQATREHAYNRHERGDALYEVANELRRQHYGN